MTGWRPFAFASHMHKLIISLLESFTMLTAHIVKITACRKLVAKRQQRCCKRATATVHALFSSSRILGDVVIFSLACKFTGQAECRLRLPKLHQIISAAIDGHNPPFCFCFYDCTIETRELAHLLHGFKVKKSVCVNAS